MLTTGRHLHYETHEHLEQNNSYAFMFSSTNDSSTEYAFYF